jgi:hypothetical protein
MRRLASRDGDDDREKTLRRKMGDLNDIAFEAMRCLITKPGLTFENVGLENYSKIIADSAYDIAERMLLNEERYLTKLREKQDEQNISAV